MADLLTHVLVVAAVGTLAARRGLVARRFLPLAAVGAVAPDATKLTLLLGVQWGRVGGIPYSAWGYHTLGGVAVVAALGAVIVRRGDRGPAALALAAGGVSHLCLDLLVIRADGVAPPYLYPLTDWLPPAGNVYLSSDYWPAVVACCLAGLVWLLDRHVDPPTDDPPDGHVADDEPSDGHAADDTPPTDDREP
ncbi:metal-dependent hydrolase [Halobaculum sp. MBLA0147]|uniref:metal-dependent hydrolase n=1 Tax=Halobaculum sp. MBLA0147 TaxID=3079934 RepID=UPI00352350B1